MNELTERLEKIERQVAVMVEMHSKARQLAALQQETIRRLAELLGIKETDLPGIRISPN